MNLKSKIWYNIVVPIVLRKLGWKRSKRIKGRWIDPNNPNENIVTTSYAWYVTKLRVTNRTDTEYLKVTNSDLAELVS